MINNESAFNIVSSIVNVPHAIRCGLHSNIKYCCILYWIFYYQWADVMDGCRDGFDYIPCPLCVEKEPRKIKGCSCWETSKLYKYTWEIRDWICKKLNVTS
jgi:hypothetical protein